MQIITGKTGTNHVTAEDDRALHAGTFGCGTYILNVGTQLAATVKTANEIELADGELVIQGTHARIRHGDKETVTFDNGTTGYNRIDLVVARYKKVADTENVEIVVIKGDSTPGTPTVPNYTGGQILEGAELAEEPLYTVRFTGVNIESVTRVVPVLTGLNDIYRKNEVYNKSETYNKGELYTKAEINNTVSGINVGLDDLSNLMNGNINSIEDVNVIAATNQANISSVKASMTSLKSTLMSESLTLKATNLDTLTEAIKSAFSKFASQIPFN